MPGIKVPMPCIMGVDFAGDIVETGSAVTDWKVGARVMVDPVDRVGPGGLLGEMWHGGLAEYCRVPTHHLVTLPDDVSYEAAACLPVAYGTAVLALSGKEITFDGSGRHVCERTLPLGLRERAICDGQNLWHLYPELAIGARRTVSRFHRANRRETRSPSSHSRSSGRRNPAWRRTQRPGCCGVPGAGPPRPCRCRRCSS